MGQIASSSQLRMSFIRWALVTVPLVLFLGIISGQLAGSGYGNSWFDALEKPAIMPPGWTFGAVWTVLYILIGVVLANILSARGARGRGLIVALLLAQLLLNYGWAPLFFAAHQVTLALVLIVVILLVALAATLLLWRVRRGSAMLMLPYLAWLIFAGFLNFQILQLNPEAEALAPGGSTTQIEF